MMDINDRILKTEQSLQFIINSYKELRDICYRKEKETIKTSWLETWYSHFANTTADLKGIVAEIKDLKEKLETESILGTLKFMAKEINELKKTVELIKEKGVNKQIHFDLTFDGASMIKREDAIKYTETHELLQERNLHTLMEGLSENQKTTIILRFGLFGEKKHTFDEIGKKLDVTAPQARQNLVNAMTKFRHPARKKTVNSLEHQELKKFILQKK